MDYTLRVIVSQDDYRKVVLHESEAEDVDTLTAALSKKLDVKYQFRLQYQDKDFDNEFFNLTDAKDIQDKSTVKIIRLSVLDSDDLDSIDESILDGSFMTNASKDLDSTAGSSVISDADTISVTSSEHGEKIPWPKEFLIPKFSYNTELKLQHGNNEFKKNGTHISTAHIKQDILDRLAEVIYRHKAYPTDLQIEAVAEALVKKHPCLKEQGSQTGYYGWKVSLKFKMGNYRAKLRSLGLPELTANSLKRKDMEDRKPAKNIKKPKRAEVNYLPNLPPGESEATLEELRATLQDEVKKKDNNQTVNELMKKTFPLRRKDIVVSQAMIADICERWPALCTESQVCEEFARIAAIPLRSTFYQNLDQHTPKLLRLFEKKGGVHGDRISRVLDKLKEAERGIDEKRGIMLQGLALYLKEDLTELVKECSEDEEKDLTMAVVGNPDACVHIVIEGNVVIDEIESVTQGIVVLFGLTYALNLSYPKKLKYFFESVQKILMDLDDGRQPSPKVQGLKLKLYDV